MTPPFALVFATVPSHPTTTKLPSSMLFDSKNLHIPLQIFLLFRNRLRNDPNILDLARPPMLYFLLPLFYGNIENLFVLASIERETYNWFSSVYFFFNLMARLLPCSTHFTSVNNQRWVWFSCSFHVAVILILSLKKAFPFSSILIRKLTPENIIVCQNNFTHLFLYHSSTFPALLPIVL